jgi:hypothetical protein
LKNSQLQTIATPNNPCYNYIQEWRPLIEEELFVDTQSLAQQIAAFLMPLLPYLAKAGEKAAEEMGKKIAGEAWEQAKALWNKLRGKKNIEQASQTAIALHEALREEIARALEEDPTLREEVTTIYGRVEVRDVKRGGKVAGVKATGKSPKKIRGEVKARDVAGEVTGVELRDE